MYFFFYLLISLLLVTILKMPKELGVCLFILATSSREIITWNLGGFRRYATTKLTFADFTSFRSTAELAVGVQTAQVISPIDLFSNNFTPFLSLTLLPVHVYITQFYFAVFDCTLRPSRRVLRNRRKTQNKRNRTALKTNPLGSSRNVDCSSWFITGMLAVKKELDFARGLKCRSCMSNDDFLFPWRSSITLSLF